MHSRTPAETRRIGARLGRLLQPGDALLLQGELGAGKTMLTQGIGQGLKVEEPVKSSSFVLMNEYHGRLTLYHADLYRLTVRHVMQLDGFAERSARNLVEAIAASRSRGLRHLLNGLGIPGVGEHVARLLADHFGRLDRLARASAEEIGRVRGVGPVIAESVERFFADRGNRRVIERLAAGGVSTLERWAARGRGPLAGKTFVLTGALEELTRDAATDLIERAGGRVTDAVSRKADHLVVGAKPGSKVDEARRLGVKLLDERELMAMAGRA